VSYTETLAAFASATETTILALHARYETGEITGAQFVALAAAALIRAGAQGAALADMALSASLSVQRKRPGPALGLTLPDDAPVNTRAAVADTLNGEPYRLDPLAAVAVVGRAEALASAQDAYGAGMRQHRVSGWTRVLNGGACALCQDLTGPVLPASAQMYHHKGCGCTQQPIDD